MKDFIIPFSCRCVSLVDPLCQKSAIGVVICFDLLLINLLHFTSRHSHIALVDLSLLNFQLNSSVYIHILSDWLPPLGIPMEQLSYYTCSSRPLCWPFWPTRPPKSMGLMCMRLRWLDILAMHWLRCFIFASLGIVWLKR